MAIPVPASSDQYTGAFWNEDVWLPPNVTWSHLTNNNGQRGVNYRVFTDLWYPIPAAFVVILIRSLVERLFLHFSNLKRLQESLY